MGGLQEEGRAIDRTVLGTDRTTAWLGLLDDAETAVLDRKSDTVI